MSSVFSCRVYYSDTDCEGIAYHGRYLDWAEHARTEWMRSLFGSPSEMQSRFHMLFVVKSVAVEYHAPARLDDLLEVESSVLEWGAFSFVILQSVRCGSEEKATLKVKVACLDERTMRLVKLPESFKSLFS